MVLKSKQPLERLYANAGTQKRLTLFSK